MSLCSYPKVFAIGHGAVKELFYDEVLVEEKVDGSQFSFGLTDSELQVRSKGQHMNLELPEKMFNKAVETVKALKDKLHPGWTYRGEFLQKPKHNVLAYDRVPNGNIILFDINTGDEVYLSRQEKEQEAIRLGLEIVPVLFQGKISSAHDLAKLLETVSVLGGQKIEGFVVKNYARFSFDNKALMGKFVSESFKEKHKVDWKTENPGQADIIQLITNTYRTPARWDKAIQHLRERGELENSPRDIPKIILEARKDFQEECQAEVVEILLKWSMDKILRGLNGGVAEYYKEKLFKSQFEQGEKEDEHSQDHKEAARLGNRRTG